MATVGNHIRPNVGVIGDRRRRNAAGGPTRQAAVVTERKKIIFMLRSNIPFELDIKYFPVKVLGSGSYGVVCSCLNRETKEMVAIKKIGDALSNRVAALRTLREIQILRHIHHNNVVSLKDVMVSSSPWGKFDFQQVYLVQELMDFDLGHVISNLKLGGDQCKYLLFQMLRGLEYLHSVNVVHRDIKPENLLIRANNLDLKICDFGLARTKNQDEQFMTEYVVTRWYRAPEILLGSKHYGSEIDLWSIGCIFAEMLGGPRPIFRGNSSLSQIIEIHKVLGTQSDLSFIDDERSRLFMEQLPRTLGVSFRVMCPEADSLAIDLLSKMLVMDPLKRISAKEALQHPYFSGIYDPTRDCYAPMRLKLAVDECPDRVDMNVLRALIWEEMLLFHPEERRSYGMF